MSGAKDTQGVSVSQGTGWVDIQTNVISQNALSFSETMDHLGAEGKLPATHLPLFLHEITHWWCFHSPVGVALTLLHERVYLLVSGSDVSKCGSLLWETLLKYEVARVLLMPLIEGLALFAEFDSLPADSTAISESAKWAGLLFLPGELDQPPTLNRYKEAWKRLASAHRASPQGIARKRLLLTAPILGVGRGAYFRGYLTVKELFRCAKARSPRFDDTDFFLTYTRNVIFNDTYLAAILLDPMISGHQWASALYERFSSRLDCFSHPELHAKALLLEALLENEDHTPVRIAESIFVTAESVHRFEETRKTWLHSPCEISLDEQSIEQWRWRIPLLLHHRSLLRLSDYRGRVVVDEQRQVWISAAHGLRRIGPAEPTAQIGEADGEAFLYLIPRFKTLALMVYANGKKVRSFVPKEVSKDEVLLDFAAIHGLFLRNYLGPELPSPRAMLSWFVGLEDSVRNCETSTESDYIGFIFRNATNEQREYCRENMARTGLYRLLHCDGRLVDAFATIGALSGAGENLEGIERRLEQEGVDLSTIIKEAQSIQANYGLPLLEFDYNNKRDDGLHPGSVRYCL